VKRLVAYVNERHDKLVKLINKMPAGKLVDIVHKLVDKYGHDELEEIHYMEMDMLNDQVVDSTPWRMMQMCYEGFDESDQTDVFNPFSDYFRFDEDRLVSSSAEVVGNIMQAYADDIADALVQHPAAGDDYDDVRNILS